MPQTNPCVANGSLPPDIYTANLSSQLTYNINFEFDAEADVVVYRESPAGTFTLLTNTATPGALNYTINQGVSPALVTFTVAPGGDSLIIGRRTNICEPVAEFQVGAAIRAGDLNADFTQLLHLIQEQRSILGFLINGNSDDPIIPGQGMDLGDLDDVTLADPIPNPSLIRWNGNEWVNNDVQLSSNAWVANDATFATTLASDNRYLSAPIPGVGTLVNGIGTSVAQIGNDFGINIVPSTFWGQTYPDNSAQGTASSIDGNVSGVGTVQFGTGDTYTFPATDGNAGTVLSTNGSGLLNWIAVSGGGGSNAVVVADVAALNIAAAGLDAGDAGDIYLVGNSTNIDTAASPAVVNLPTAPKGGWSDQIQTTLQWNGTAWIFIRYAAVTPDERYVTIADTSTMTGDLILNGAPTVNNQAATKKYVDDSIPSVPTVNDSTITLSAGTGLTGGGSFTLNQAANETITFTNSVTAFNGGEVTTSITTPERTITAGAFDLSTGPYWTCGAIAIPNPTNAVSGMAGLIRVTAAPTSWDTNFSTAPTPTVFPSIIPFYVQSATSIRLGQAVGVA